MKFRSTRRAVLLTSLALLGLGGLLGGHLWRTRHDVRMVSPLPLHAPGYTLDDGTGAGMRVVPLAGARLRSVAAPDPGTTPPQGPPHAAH
ncbi:hypothetical protein [uncultured Desulfovibrio sp.]|uniref:hypothetical protein n=1 Tax=uncultured Desulfovibrio sp. TaxID=167968 RepID=UPI0025D27FDA|nr:hypothetical protein [uncultured Desulfovibrio sp.]